MLKCSECDKEYTASNSLKIHMMTHSGEKPHACSVCNRQFTRRSYLTVHMRRHSGEKPFKCSLCGKTFRQRGNLVKHSKVHAGVKPFACDVCNKLFAERYQLEIHLRVHSGWKPFICKVCGKAFTQAGNLYTHEKIHSGARPFKCSECGGSFIRKADYEKHLRTHIGVSPYLCLLCNKGYKRINVLFTHIKKIHSSQKCFGCGFCYKEFFDVRNFTEHVNFYFIHNYCMTQKNIQKINSKSDELKGPEKITKKTDEIVMENPKSSIYKAKDDHIIIVIDEKENSDEYKVCGNKSSTKGDQENMSMSVGKKTRKRRKTKSFNCMICGKTFRFAKKLDVHMRKHKGELCGGSIPLKEGQLKPTREKSFECDFCHRTFPLKRNLAVHMKVHAREKPLACHICSKLFSSESNLTVHLETHAGEKTYCNPSYEKDSKGHKQTEKLSEVSCAEQSFHCSLCSKVFNDVRSHRRHMKAHTSVENADSPQKLDGPGKDRIENDGVSRPEIVLSELGTCIEIEVDADMQCLWNSSGDCVSENESVMKKTGDESGEFLLPIPESVTIEVKEVSYGEILGVAYENCQCDVNI